jgi:hypothetical protein
MSDQLRGVCIEPSGKSKQLGSTSEVFYYLCLVDVPQGVTVDDFELLGAVNYNQGESGDPTLQFSYSKNASHPLLNGPFVNTIALPIYTYPVQGNQSTCKILTKVKIYDKNLSGNVLLEGDPNKRKPPVVEMMIPNTGADSGIPTTCVLQSNLVIADGNGVEGKPLYFILAMVNTGSAGGYSYQLTLTPNGTTLNGTLTPNGSASTVAAIGVYPATLYQFYHLTIGNNTSAISYPESPL